MKNGRWKNGDAIAVTLFIVAMFVIFFRTQQPVSAQSETGSSQYLYIHTAATTPIKDGAGFLSGVTLNGGTPGTVTLYDVAAQGCASTPSSGKFATIEATSSTNPTSMPFFNLKFTNGLCAVTAAATDATVIYN